jgi:general secretion pathway protein E
MPLAAELVSELPITEDFRPEYLRDCGMLPIRFRDDRLQVAVHGAPPADVLEDLELFYGAPLDLVVVAPEALEEAIRRTFAATESVVELVRGLEDDVSAADPLGGDEPTDLRDLANQAPVVRYVNLLVREAHDSGASDVHLEATREGLRARMRLDGVLVEAPSPPRGLQQAVVSRVKLLASMDIAERRAPQDGRIRVKLETRELDLRVSTVPTLHGESVVIRLLDRGGRPVTLEELGLAPDLLEAIGRLARRPHGIVLATGPTGSGKTTTLYAALKLRDSVAEKLITVEDPVEYDLPGVTQFPVQTKAGVTFAGALRSILRQDPDVLMVGEMRDRETASIAVQAAMTGHLVFSTLHTNDAPAAVVRLLDLGVEPYLVAATLEGVLAQRLVRRTCPDCRERYEPDAQAVAWLAGTPIGERDGRWRWERGAGCAACRGTGFRGRGGLFELMPVTEALREALLRAPDAESLRSTARGEGMRSLREDGWRVVRAGLTTVEEVLRVLGA